MLLRLLGRTMPVLALAVAGAAVHASDTVKLIASAAPGGPQDRISRILLPALSASLGKTVIVDYKGGAGGTLASNVVAQAPADGETLLVTTFSYVLTAGSMPNLPYDARKDLDPLYLLGQTPTMIAVRPGLGVANLKELAAKAKASKLNYGSNGVAGTMHLGAELFAKSARVQMTNVPYRGAAPALMDLLAGTVDLVSADVPLLQPYVNDGRLKGLAVFGSTRSPLVPNVPTAGEEGFPELQMTSWIGVMAPKGLPPAVRAKLVQALGDAVRKPENVRLLAELGYIDPRNDVQFKAKLDQDFAFWLPWLKNAGIRAE